MIISIIMPVYNNEGHLSDSINSVLQQRSKAWELIIVNDGSTDCTGKICDEYAKKDNRIKVIHTQNYGPADARNIGIQNANGKYCIFLDSDDFIDGYMYETKIKILKNYHADVIESGYRRFNDEGIHEEAHFTEEMLFNGLTNTISAVKQDNNFCVEIGRAHV